MHGSAFHDSDCIRILQLLQKRLPIPEPEEASVCKILSAAVEGVDQISELVGFLYLSLIHISEPTRRS